MKGILLIGGLIAAWIVIGKIGDQKVQEEKQKLEGKPIQKSWLERNMWWIVMAIILAVINFAKKFM